MFTPKRILIITNAMKFALNVKKALENSGQYEVAVFSSGKAGVDHVRRYSNADIAVIDFRMKDMPGTDMVDHVRAMRPEIIVIAAPDHPAIHDLKERHNIQEIINLPVSIRRFAQVIQAVTGDVSTQRRPNVSSSSADKLSVSGTSQMLEFWVSNRIDGSMLVQADAVNDEPAISPESSATFQRLAAEEPPMPAFADGSTIRDLRARLTNIDTIQRTLAAAVEEDTETSEPFLASADDDIPASRILDITVGESTPLPIFSNDEFEQRVKESGIPGIQALFTWKRDGERYVVEPEFLGQLPSLQEAIEYTGTVTIFSAPHLEGQEPGDWTTDRIEPQQRSHPIEGDRPSAPPRPTTLPEEGTTLDDEEAQAHITELGRPTPPLPPELPDLTVASDADTDTLPFIEFDEDDSEVVQMVTTLVQVSLEFTAEATVIARDGMIVGYAGKLPMSDLQELFDQLTVEWDKANGNDKSRILFATLSDTGAEFMVSTRATQSGFTLSLIFSGTRPLHDIRRQSKRLLEALATLPEPDLLEEPPVPTLSTAEVGARTPIAYLWLLRDPQRDFDNATQKILRKALDMELKINGWKVSAIHAPDYVYIYGEIPTRLSPRETLSELMIKTASLMKTDPEKLWDDSYLILQPGREIKAEEIQTFIHFARR